MTNAKFIMSIMLFQFFFSVILAGISETTFDLLSPITFSAISILLVAVIAASNTPVIKGAALALLWGGVVVFFVFSEIPILIFGLVIVPMLIGMGLAMAEIGQG
jgi:hypothetical protein